MVLPLFELWPIRIRSVVLYLCKKIDAVSYPQGSISAVSKEVAHLAKKAGYKCGWTMERALNLTIEDPFLFARIDYSDFHKVEKFSYRKNFHEEIAQNSSVFTCNYP